MEFMKYVILAMFIAGLLFITQIAFYLKQYTDFKIVGIQFITLGFLCFIYDNGTDLVSHGAYNRFILFISMLISGFLLTLGKILSYSIRRSPIISIILIAVSVYAIHLKVDRVFATSCIGWEDGLKGTKMINAPESQCKIHHPQTCYYEIFDGLFDVTKMLGETCENNGSNLFSNIEKYISDKTSKIIGYPRTENWNVFPDSTYGVFNKKVMSSIVNMEDSTIKKDDIEITTNFYKNPPEVNINLKRNEELAKQRSETFNKNSKDKVMAKNIIHLFIDSLSRNNFKHKVPKFYKWIEKFYSKYIILI
jgi:hypothetical protein